MLGADFSTGIHVKEEAQEAESIGAVLSTIGLPEEVADEPVATEVSEVLEPVSTPAELGPDEVAAEVAFSDLDRIKEEGRDQAEAPSSPSEQVEAETTDILGLGDESAVVGDPEAPASASEPLPTVADPSGVATEATASDTSVLVAPPTSPNLVEPGSDPVQVGHSPSAPSTGPRRTRTRGSPGGGQTTRWQEALREWWLDFEKAQSWLYSNSGGDIARGFWLERHSLEDVDSGQKWFYL